MNGGVSWLPDVVKTNSRATRNQAQPNGAPNSLNWNIRGAGGGAALPAGSRRRPGAPVGRGLKSHHGAERPRAGVSP